MPLCVPVSESLSLCLGSGAVQKGQEGDALQSSPSSGRPMSVDMSPVTLPSDITLRPILCQELTDNISAAESSPLPAVMNIVSLENSDTH